MLSGRVVALLSCIGALSLTHAVVKLGDLIKPCSLKDPNLDQCMTAQGQALLPYMVEGIQDFGLLPMDPLSVPDIKAERRGGPFLSLKINATNTTQLGYKNMVIESIRFDPDKYIMKFDAYFPTYVITGNYGVDGHVLLVPISGSGFLNITLVRMQYRHTFNFRPVEREGEKYLELKNIKSNVTARNLIWKVDNLFGNKRLSDLMNIFLNRNSLAIYKEIDDDVQALTADINKSIIRTLFEKIPLRQLFKDVD